MKQYIRYLVIWAVNLCIVLLANKLLPSNYVLGNAVIPPIYAAVFTGFLLMVFDRAMKPVIKKLIQKEENRYVMFLIYWFINTVGIWTLARVSVVSGFGISAFYYAIILGFTACLAQWVARQIFKAAKFLQ